MRARRSPPVLTLPGTLACGHAFVGGDVTVDFGAANTGGAGRFFVMDKAKWEAGDAKLKATYPTRAELDGWLDKQCQASKDKSLWKRTRAAKKKAAQAAEGGAAQAAALKKPALTREGARELLTAALDAFKQPANKEELLAIVAECDALGPEQAGMMKMVMCCPWPILRSRKAPCAKSRKTMSLPSVSTARALRLCLISMPVVWI